MRFGRTTPDKLLTAYILLSIVLSARHGSFTGVLRHTFYLFTDTFLPYYAASRLIQNIAGFRDALFSFLIAASIVAAIGTFEHLKHWLLYQPLIGALQLKWPFLNYMGRGGGLRAVASTGHPIALGYVMVVGLGFLAYLSRLVRPGWQRTTALLALLGGLFASLSRGPWLGAAALLVTYVATGRHATRRLAIAIIGFVLAVPLLSVVPGGQRFVDLLPFIGETHKGSIDYRQQLVSNSLDVILQNPLFGSVDFLETSEMEEMRQGEGIIDVVNSYLSVALNSGLVGLALFVGIFLAILMWIFRGFRHDPCQGCEAAHLGRALLATLIGVLVTIGTVSGITIIPVVYWSLAGLGVAYARLAVAGDLAVPNSSGFPRESAGE